MPRPPRVGRKRYLQRRTGTWWWWVRSSGGDAWMRRIVKARREVSEGVIDASPEVKTYRSDRDDFVLLTQSGETRSRVADATVKSGIRTFCLQTILVVFNNCELRTD